MNLFTVLFNSIRAKITPLVTKIKLWTSPSYLKTRGVMKIREFFSNILNIKPKNKNDYFTVFGWMISKKLAYAVVIAIGVLSLGYLITLRSGWFSAGDTAAIKTYKYNSVLLRYADATVRIKAHDGHIAYVGDVKDGYANGKGTLYNKEGTAVYVGEFVHNKYEGNGIEYYDSSKMKYSGQFSENMYEGRGKLYRENGSVEYEGEFSRDMKDGAGTLYDNGNNPIYKGNFTKNNIVYSELLGKTTSQVADCYTGDRMVNSDNTVFDVILTDIDAMYEGYVDSEKLTGEIEVGVVYILKDYFDTGDKKLTKMPDVEAYFQNTDYEGNSKITMGEAIAINYQNSRKDILNGTVAMDSEFVYEDYRQINGYDQDYYVYLYSFHKDGVVYTFVTKDRDNTFAFYFIEKEKGASNES